MNQQLNHDQAIIAEALESVKAALASVANDTYMKRNRFALWLKCKEAQDYLLDEELRLQAVFIQARTLQAEVERLRAELARLNERVERERNY